MAIEDVDLPQDDEVYLLAEVESKFGIPASQVLYLGSEGVLELCVLAEDWLRFWCVDEESVHIRSVGGVFPHADDYRAFPREIHRKPSKPTKKILLLSLTDQACRGLIAYPRGYFPEYTFPAGFAEKKSKAGGRRKRVEKVLPDRNPDDPLSEAMRDSGKWCFSAFREDERFEFDPQLGYPMIFGVPVGSNNIFVIGAGLSALLKKLRLQPELAAAYKSGQPTIKMSALSSAISVAAQAESTLVDTAVSLPASEPAPIEVVPVQPDAAVLEPANDPAPAPAPAPAPVSEPEPLPAEVMQPEVVQVVAVQAEAVQAEVVSSPANISTPADVSPPIVPVMPPFRRVRIAEMAEIYGFKNTKTVDARCTPGKPGYDPTYPAMHKDEKGKYWISTEVDKHQQESVQRDLVVKKPKAD